MTIGNRTSSALDVLLAKKQLSYVINACETLGNENDTKFYENILIFKKLQRFAQGCQ